MKTFSLIRSKLSGNVAEGELQFNGKVMPCENSQKLAIEGMILCLYDPLLFNCENLS